MTKKIVLFACVLLLGLTSVAIAAGTVYYGPTGTNSGGCGVSFPCRTKSKAMSRACTLSGSNETIYYVYHTNGAYAGACDVSGGSGVEPRDDDPDVSYDLSGILWPTLSMFVAGLILGGITLGRRREGR